MINAPPTKQAPIKIRWVAVWILRRVSGLSPECSGATALSPTGTDRGRHNDHHQDQQQSPGPPRGCDGADALGDAQIERQRRKVGEHSQQPGGQQRTTARGQRVIFGPAMRQQQSDAGGSARLARHHR